jgi:hypothetical protein
MGKHMTMGRGRIPIPEREQSLEAIFHLITKKNSF